MRPPVGAGVAVAVGRGVGSTVDVAVGAGGGVLVAVPKTRNLGLLVLGPIVVNILAFHVFLTKGAGLFDPPVLAIAVLSAFLLFSERKAFAGLING